MLKRAALISVLMMLPSLSHSTVQTKKQIDCLATNIYHEAKGESRKGKLAVGFVTINRTKSGKFPKDICAVVHQKTNKTFQFSWVRNKKNVKVNSELYADIRDIAELVYHNYDDLDDPTNGSLYFHSTRINPKWGKKKTVVINNHVFYR